MLVLTFTISSVFSSVQSLNCVQQSCVQLCDPTNCSTPGLPVHPQLPELAQTHVHQVGDAASIERLCMPGFLLSC